MISIFFSSILCRNALRETMMSEFMEDCISHPLRSKKTQLANESLSMVSFG